MRRVTVILVLALSLYSAGVLSQQPGATGAIEGTVVRADTGEPMAGAQVTLRTAPPLLEGSARAADLAARAVPCAAPAPAPPGVVVAPADRAPRSVTAGPGGTFAFRNLTAGAYCILGTADGFVRQEFGQRAPHGAGRPIFLDDGEILRGVIVRPSPAGVVTGRVLDENGRPATGVLVRLLRPVHGSRGRTLHSAGRGVADDRGDYRIYGVIPGRYYLSAGTPPGPEASATSSPARGTAAAARFSTVYYPASAAPDQASPIEVASGKDARFDMRVRRQTLTYRVRGHVVNATGTPLPADTSVTLVYTTLGESLSWPLSGGRILDPVTGAFELQGVPPGDYFLRAQIPSQVPPDLSALLSVSQSLMEGRPPDAAGMAVMRAAAVFPTAQVPVHVVQADVDGLMLSLTSGVSVKGRFIVEGQSIGTPLNVQRMSLAFVETDTQAPSWPTPATGPVNPDGTFEVVGVRVGAYRVIVLAPAEASGYYVRSLQFGGRDIFNGPFEFTGEGSGTIDVTVRGGGRITGRVIDGGAQPVAGIRVMAIPVQRNRTFDYRTAVADRSGRYSMTGLAPGDYQIFSWEAIDSGAHYDPDFLKRHETRGTTVRVTESSAQSVDITVIPAQ
jgi:hypothetical protein